MTHFTPLLLALTLLLMAGCADQAEQQPAAADSMAAETMQMAERPDTTAASLWNHLRKDDYESWNAWPGKDDLYAGQEPHGMLLKTYVNTAALEAIQSDAAMMPDGAIIVKENYMPDSTLAAITVMHKVSGYDPANNDWYWAKYNADGSIDGAGRLAMCQACHSGQRANDFVMTDAGM